MKNKQLKQQQQQNQIAHIFSIDKLRKQKR